MTATVYGGTTGTTGRLGSSGDQAAERTLHPVGSKALAPDSTCVDFFAQTCSSLGFPYEKEKRLRPLPRSRPCSPATRVRQASAAAQAFCAPSCWTPLPQLGYERRRI